MAPDAEHELDEEAKKHTLRLVPYGLYLVGTRAGADTDMEPEGSGASPRSEARGEDPARGGPHAFLGSWVTQCSFDPPLVALAIRKESHGHALIEESGVLTLNPLAEDQLDLARRFIRNVNVTDHDMEGTPYTPGDATGAPIFTDLPASLELQVEEHAADEGDHTVFICRVVAATQRDDRPILTHQDAGMTYAG